MLFINLFLSQKNSDLKKKMTQPVFKHYPSLNIFLYFYADVYINVLKLTDTYRTYREHNKNSKRCQNYFNPFSTENEKKKIVFNFLNVWHIERKILFCLLEVFFLFCLFVCLSHSFSPPPKTWTMWCFII